MHSKPHRLVKLGGSKRFLCSKFINLLSALQQKEATFYKGEQITMQNSCFSNCLSTICSQTKYLGLCFLIIIPLEVYFISTQQLRRALHFPWREISYLSFIVNKKKILLYLNLFFSKKWECRTKTCYLTQLENWNNK